MKTDMKEAVILKENLTGLHMVYGHKLVKSFEVIIVIVNLMVMES